MHPSAKASFESLPLTPVELHARAVCDELLAACPGYQGSFAFGTPGGNDLDLRLCFATLEGVPEDEIRRAFHASLRHRGVETELDLLFMTAEEFESGIRDLVELGTVEERLHDGFDPHEQQAAVGDTSFFSLYIFATMRLLHQNTLELGSPQAALKRLELTPEGAIGWMHFYTGCFLQEYLKHDALAFEKYQERVAKFFARVTAGSTLAKLIEPQLAAIKWSLVGAIQAAGPANSTDANISRVLTTEPLTARLLDGESVELLEHAGNVRNGQTAAVPADFTMRAQDRLFLHAFDQGSHRRPEAGENVDPLTCYALGAALDGLGTLQTFEPNETLIKQGTLGTKIFYIPLKTSQRKPNVGVDILVTDARGKEVARYNRTPGRAVGEGALFGVLRSATVRAQGELEAYVIDAAAVNLLLADKTLFAQLRQPALHSENARRLDVLLRYLAREASIFTRQTLPYTTLADAQTARQKLGDNPLKLYDLGDKFLRTLRSYAEAEDTAAPVVTLSANAPRTLFETGAENHRLFVVVKGSVEIGLPAAKETITLGRGEYFGESSLLGLPSTGTAVLTPGSQVLSVSGDWFKRFTQAREHPPDAPVPPELAGVLPIHLLYHLAAQGYDRVRRRLLTQR